MVEGRDPAGPRAPARGETIYTVGGAVQASQGLYIPRRADDDLLALCRAGTFAYILSPRQVGKSSLMIHTAERLEAEGRRVVLLDLTAIGTQVAAADWYFGLLYEIADQLALEVDLYAWWQSRTDLGATQRFTQFFKDIVLEAITAPLVVFVDEIDTTLSLPFADDFFAAIRAFHDVRARVAAFRRLSFVLIGVATPGDLIHDPKRTPFNLGQRVEMTDFSLEEARPLAAGLGLASAEAQQVLGWVLAWTGGHPYLTQRLCQALTQEGRAHSSAATVAAVVRRLFFGAESGQDNNIQFVRDMLTKRAPDPAAVLRVYRDVRRTRPPVANAEHSLVQSHLKLAGIVRREHEVLRVRNPIYRGVFDERWIKAHLPAPINWVRGLRRALAALLMVFVLSVIALGLYAQARRQEAEQAKTLAEARELAIRAQTAADPEAGLLLAIAAAREMQAGQVDDANGQMARVLSQAIADSPIRLRLRHPAPLTSAAWGSGGRIATATADGLVRLWTLPPGAAGGVLPPLATFPTPGGPANSLAWSPDSRALLGAGPGAQATIWDASSGTVRLVLRGHSAEVLSAAWSPDGRSVVTASRDNTAILWDATSGRPLRTLRGHSGWVRSAAWSPDGRSLVTASADTTAKIWDVATGQERLTLRGHIRDVRAAAWSPDGRLLVTASEDRTAKVWDAATGQEQLTLRGHSGAVEAAAWSPDSSRVVTASADGTARAWDVAAGGGQEQLTLRGHSGAVHSAAFSPDGRLILTAGADGTARVWDAAGAPERLTLRGPAGAMTAAGCSADGARAWTAAADGSLTLWDTARGQLLGSARGPQGSVRGLAYSPDGHLLLTAGSDGTARVWDAGAGPGSGPARVVLRGPGAAVHSAAWSPDGRLIVTAGDDGTARVWNAAGGPETALLHAGTQPLRIVAWSPDGRAIVTAGDDGTARVWDAAGGPARLVLQGHSDAVLSAAWSPDGRLIVTASADGTARVWDAAGGQERLVFHSAGGAVLGATWCGGGSFVLTAGADGSARQYPVDLPDLLALATTRVTRALSAAEATQFGIAPTATAPPAPAVAAAGATSTATPVTATAAPPARPSATGPPHPGALPEPGGRLAFASNRGTAPQSHIYVMGPDGAGQHALTSAPLDNLYPDWSPDGRRLVYMAANPDIPADSPAGDLFLMQADGTGRVQLTHGLNAKWPKWSPDGNAILYADGPENRSPVFDLYLITLADHAIRRLTDAPGFDGYPAWTPDGRIIFTSARADSLTHLFSMNADGSNPQQLTFGPGEQQNAAVAPDGSRIAFVATPDGTEHLYTMARDGTDVQQITAGAGADRYPSWSPDGRWIAFHSNRDGGNHFAIYLVPAGGGAVRRLTSGTGDDDEPAWQR